MYSSLEATDILAVRLGVMLLKDGGVLSQQSSFLDVDDISLTTLFLLFKLLLGKFGLALLLVDSKLFLPKALDFSLMFEFTHAASLRIHLLESVILGELLHQLALELFLHASLLFSTLSLKSKLVLTGSLELLTNADSLLSFSHLLHLGGFLGFLNIEVVSKLLLEHLLSSSLLLLGGKLLEDLITDGLSLLFHSFDLILTGLLLLSVPADHFVLVLVHLSLALEKCTFLVHGKDHISLGLFFLLLSDAVLLVVFLNHALDDSVDLGLLSKVLIVSLLSSLISVINLLLNGALV